MAHIPSFIQKRAFSTVSTSHVLTKIRGGSSGEESEEYDDESSDDEYDSEEYDTDSEEEESDEEEEEEAVTKSSLKSSILSKSQDATEEIEYDEVLTAPAMAQFGIQIGVMLLSNRVDILNAKAVQIARFAFLAYLFSVQVFLLYVWLRAKSIDDRTPITISNPLASLVQNGAMGGAAAAAANGGGGNFMVKALADQILCSETTILEYDLKQAKKMNGGLLVPMVVLYFLHFRMKQVQPLIMQTATGVLNWVYSPLFQVYVLGRNLERPFKPPVNPMMEAMQDGEGKEGDTVGTDEKGEDENDIEKEEEVVSKDDDEEEEASDSDEEEASDDEEEAGEEEEGSDDESEYDDSDDEE